MKNIFKVMGLISLLLIALVLITGTVFAESDLPPVEEQPNEYETSPLNEEVDNEPTGEDVVEKPPNLLVEEPALEPTTEEFGDEAHGSDPVSDAAEEPKEEPTAEPFYEVFPEASIGELTSEQTFPDPPVETQAEVILVDGDGELLDLDNLVSPVGTVYGDPWWFVGSVKYAYVYNAGDCPAGTTFGSTCFTGLSPINDALNYMNTNNLAPTNGLLHVEWHASGYSPFYIDGATMPNLAGMKGVIGYESSPGTNLFPYLSGSVTIKNLSGSFTLSGFNINGALEIDSIIGTLTLTDLTVKNTGGDGIGITNHTGDIVITRVKSNANTGRGAQVNNSSGGNITITNSAFDHNSGAFGHGIEITTNGIVSINGISASNNSQKGLGILHFSRLTIKNAILNNNQNSNGLHLLTSKVAPVVLEDVHASDNSGVYGAYVQSQGSITARNIHACGNSSNGMQIDNIYGVAIVNMSNGRFNDNGQNGLTIFSNRAITLTSIIANNNFLLGVLVDNSGGSGNVIITSPKAAGEAGSNRFCQNEQGLEIKSAGSVILTNLTASENRKNSIRKGLVVDNTYGSGSITINSNLPGWTNNFDGNVSFGIDLETNGNVNVSDISASNSGSGLTAWGMTIGGSANSVNITRATFNKHFYEGLTIEAIGTVTLTDVSASENGSGGTYSGLHINNQQSGIGTGNVTIRSSNRNVNYSFKKNSMFGILILSNGVVSVSNAESTENGYGGIWVENNMTASDKHVSLTDGNFSTNGRHGIYINSRGTITLTNIHAAGNSTSSLTLYSGAILMNTDGNGNVVIRSTAASVYHNFSDNKDNGISITTNGSVSVGNVYASNNANGYGLFIDNYNGQKKPVSVLRGEFDQNRMSGISIVSVGQVTLTDVNASNNDPSKIGTISGVNIDNLDGTGNVTICSSRTTDYYQFAGNSYAGIQVESAGVVSISNADAWGNSGSGIRVDNTAGVNKAVNILRVIATSSDQHGIEIDSKGSITLTNVNAYGNGTPGTTKYDGVNVDNNYPDSMGNVTIRSSSARDYYDFGSNGRHGINISSKGTVSVGNALSAANQTGYGLLIYNQVNSTRPVAVQRVEADNNLNDGIRIWSAGHVTLTDVTSHTNGWSGVTILNDFGNGNVTVRSSRSADYYDFSNNIGEGLDITSKGVITLINVVANENGTRGAWLNNQDVPSSTPRAVNVTRSQFIFNQNGHGLWIQTIGNVTLNSIKTNNNYLSGSYIDACVLDGGVCSTSARINLLGTNNEFSNNLWGIGLYIHSGGMVSLSNLSANENNYYGTYIENRRIPNMSVGISNGTFDQNKGDNGIFVYSNGAVTLTNVQVNSNTKNGLRIATSGAVKLNGVQAIGNGTSAGHYGGLINNSTGTAGVVIAPVKIKYPNFSENVGNGLQILTNGAVSITNASTAENGNYGLYISQSGAVTIKNTTPSNPSLFNGNIQSGLWIANASGHIVISGSNQFNDSLSDRGVRLEAITSPDPWNVTVIGATANNNYLHGFSIQTKGHVTIRNIVAENNGRSVNPSSNGLYINNYQTGSGSGNVTISGSNHFNLNTYDGLGIYTNGAINITGVTSQNNARNGLSIQGYGIGKNVLLSSIRILGNDGEGIYLYANGNQTFRNVTSLINGGDGIRSNLNGYYALIHSCIIMGNEGDGIELALGGGTYDFVNSLYFGNDADNSGTDTDLNIY